MIVHSNEMGCCCEMNAQTMCW